MSDPAPSSRNGHAVLRFDRRPGVLFLELLEAPISKSGMEPFGVVDLVDVPVQVRRRLPSVVSIIPFVDTSHPHAPNIAASSASKFRAKRRFTPKGYAVAAEADLIVSGDRHLLDLGSHHGIPIVTAAEALARIGG